MPQIIRPVEQVFPPQIKFPIVDQKTGKPTKAFHTFLLKMWERSGGSVDELAFVLASVGLGQISGLVANARVEETARALGDAFTRAQQTQIDRLVGRVAALETSLSVQQAVMTGLLGSPPPTRVTRFDQSDTWRLNPDVRSIYVACVGGGGGGAGGTAGSTSGGGGGGANFSEGWLEGQYLPSSVAITVGAAGSGGTAGNDGGDGGESSFGSYFAALGGNGGLAAGTGGAAQTTPGGVFFGGAGGPGTAGGAGTSAQNDCLGCPGGGGGAYSTGGDVGGDGGVGARRSTALEGEGGAGGLSTGGNGGSDPASRTLIGPGFGGGGGGATNAATGRGGEGYNGAGGGGGGARAAGASAGGDGGAGVVWVVEYY